MSQAHRARIIAFPNQQSKVEALPPKPGLQCIITSSPQAFRQDEHPQMALRSQQLVHSFEKKHGFLLPGLVFDSDAELQPEEWTLSLRGCELHRGKLVNWTEPLEAIAEELLSRPWKFFTYESFRMRLKELEEWEPFLAQEICHRLDLVLTWQALQALLKTGGTLHRFSAKLERLLVKAEGCSRDQFLSPRMLAALQQV